ncbi:hypothetical protein [Actinoplanes philippinensis]|uniref:hypothetical protein n=1 Tax=Actinoplanes philippinensis TaxID=35752 RepID=UPI0033CD96C2
MGFFDSLPAPPPSEPEPPVPPPPAWARPDTVIGGSVAADLLIARSAEAALALTGLVGYPNGFAFTIAAVLRERDRLGRMAQHVYPDGFAEPLPPEFLRVGVRFADGRAVTNLAGYPRDGATPGRPVLLPDRGGGGGRRYDMGFWVWPLPPAGPLTFYVAWPHHHIDETGADVDAGLLHEAAGRAIGLG